MPRKVNRKAKQKLSRRISNKARRLAKNNKTKKPPLWELEERVGRRDVWKKVKNLKDNDQEFINKKAAETKKRLGTHGQAWDKTYNLPREQSLRKKVAPFDNTKTGNSGYYQKKLAAAGLPNHSVTPLSKIAKNKAAYVKALGSEKEYNRMLLDAYQGAHWDNKKYPIWKEAKHLNHITRENTAWGLQDRAFQRWIDNNATNGKLEIYRGVTGKVRYKQSELGSSWSASSNTGVEWLALSKDLGGAKPPYRLFKATIDTKHIIPLGGDNGGLYETVVAPKNVKNIKVVDSWIWTEIKD